MNRPDELEGCALRVGLVQDGTVICEKTFRKPRRVTVGRSERNDLILVAVNVKNRYLCSGEPSKPINRVVFV